MRTRALGRTGIQVSEVGFGGLPIAGGFYGDTNDAVSRAAITRALDLGCTFFDTADVYGNGRSERLIGGEIAARRRGGDSIVIATKAGLASPDGHLPERLRVAFEGSLARLGAGAVGLFQLHDPSASTLADPAVLFLLREWKAAGRARAIGVSVASAADGLAALAAGAYDAIQVEGNLFHPGAIDEISPRAADAGVAIIVKVPLDHGMLSGKYDARTVFGEGDLRAHAPREELAWRARALEALAFLWREGSGRTPAQAALRFLLDVPGVTTVIPGVKTPEQAKEAMAASSVPPLTEDEIARARALVRRGFR